MNDANRKRSTEDLLNRLHGIEQILTLDDDAIQHRYDVEGRPYYERQGRLIQEELKRRYELEAVS